MNVDRRTFVCVLSLAAAGTAVAGPREHVHRSHFVLYAKLDKHRRTHGLESPRMPNMASLPLLPFRHAYFDVVAARPESPGMTCIGTCC